MKAYRITVEGRTFDVRLLDDPRQDRVQVEVDGQPLVVEVSASPEPPTPPPAPTKPAPAGPAPLPAASLDSAILSPLPGVIKSVAVRPGQEVAPGDLLLVVEAMKMDNAIRANREGIVEAVHVAEGQRVAHGQLMVEYRA